MTRRPDPTWDNGDEGYPPEDVERMRSAAVELDVYARATDVDGRDELRARIMAALADEPTPAPLTAMAAAAHERRAAGLVAGFRDLWRVALSGGRPLLVRLPAALAVLVLVGAVGGTGALAAAGAWTVLHPAPTATPSPTANPGPIVVPSVRPGASGTPMPTASPSSGASPFSTSAPMPTAMPRPTMGPTMSPMPKPSATPVPMVTSTPMATAMPTHHPEATHQPGHP